MKQGNMLSPRRYEDSEHLLSSGSPFASMSTKQKAFVVRIRPDSTHGLDKLNVQLGRGWHVAKVAPLGGAGVGSRDNAPELCLAALVVIERHEDTATEVIAQAEEETEEIVEGEELSEESLSEEIEEGRNGGSA
ncbi:MAG: hypothetical protein BRD40_04215 [Bacteroidetes bacterium QS_1_65_9]|nr:MAG: hypothetical protein BRD40_04215 [Bacteroidetes bacterium QS_1_65_9]